jgi:RNA-directed DNA polymerase
MSGKRQKTRDQLVKAFGPEAKGDARRAGDEGTEPLVTMRSNESQARPEQLMEAVCANENVRAALKRVMMNKGSGGVDRMTTEQLPRYLKKHWPTVRAQLLGGTYRPQPVLRIVIPKPDGGERLLGIPTVVDRFVQQAILQVLQERWDPTFSAHSFGFRPGRSAHQAVAQAQEYIAAGNGWVVDLDLEKFFDRVNHDKLMGQIAKRISDKRVLRVLRAFLTAGVMADGLVSPTAEGTPQGGPLSPLLSNLVLDELDRELERRGHRFVRYADDCNIYVRSQRAGERVMNSLREFITHKLKLRVNETKSAVARPQHRKFLGFSFTKGPQPRRRIAPKPRKRFEDRVRELTSRTAGRSLTQVIENLARYLQGWRAYFGFCQTPSVLRHLDKWIRRRLRCYVWQQWQTSHRRFQALVRGGVKETEAKKAAASSKGPWRMSNTPQMSIALPNAYFALLGLPALAP